MGLSWQATTGERVTQLRPAVLLACCAASGTVNGRIQLEFLSVNVSGLVIFSLLLELSLTESALSFTAAVQRLPER